MTAIIYRKQLSIKFGFEKIVKDLLSDFKLLDSQQTIVLDKLRSVQNIPRNKSVENSEEIIAFLKKHSFSDNSELRVIGQSDVVEKINFSLIEQNELILKAIEELQALIA